MNQNFEDLEDLKMELQSYDTEELREIRIFIENELSSRCCDEPERKPDVEQTSGFDYFQTRQGP